MGATNSDGDRMNTVLDRRQWLQAAALATGALSATGAQAGTSGSTSAVTVLATGGSKTDYAPALTALAAYAELHRQEFGLPGMTLAFADQNGWRATLTLGLSDVELKKPVKPSQLFQIGSISKSFIALSLLKMAEDGKLNLDDAVADLLPDLPLAKAPRFNVRNLLNHTAGLPDDAPLFPRGTDGLWCGFPPGSRMSYSNTGYRILGLLAEKIDGRPYAETLRERVLKPLGMAATQPLIRDSERMLYATGYSPLYRDRPYMRRDPLASGPWTPVAEAAGSVASTPGDMSLYLAFLIAAGQGKGAPVFSDASARLFVTPPEVEAPVFGPGARYAYGVGLVPFGAQTLIHHTGGMLTFSSSFHVDAASGVGAFASTNCSVSEKYRPRLITAFACQLLAAARAGEPLPSPPPIPPMAPADPHDVTLEPLVSLAGDRIALEIAGDSMQAIWNGRPIPVESADADIYLLGDPKLQILPLTLERANDKVVAAWWGGVRFAADPVQRSPPPVPIRLKATEGRYDSDDPWGPGLNRVTAQGDILVLNGQEPLVPLPGGDYRVGAEAWGCERVRFEAPVGGQMQRLVVSGADTLRTGEATEV
jgi:CubicO group peptidase (beta-lactamase class C family)